MKTILKTTALLLLCLTFSLSYAQTTWTTTAGNTLTGGTLPSAPNEWLGSSNSADVIFKTGAVERFRISTTATNSSPMFSIKSASVSSASEHILNMTVSDAASDFFRVMNGTGGNGNFYPIVVGYKSSTGYTPGLGLVGSVVSTMDYSPSGFDPGAGIIAFNARRDYNGVSGGSAIVNRPLFTWSNYTTQYMTMLANGKVGIKTILPTADLTVNGNVLIGDPFTVCIPNTNYKLFVETGILTEKLKVAVNCATDWADYVFDESYDLKSIKDLELFVKENKHLPNVPSAADVVRDGVDMATMDSKLLEKIEELSLYIIELKKESEKLEKRILEIEKK